MQTLMRKCVTRPINKIGKVCPNSFRGTANRPKVPIPTNSLPPAWYISKGETVKYFIIYEQTQQEHLLQIFTYFRYALGRHQKMFTEMEMHYLRLFLSYSTLANVLSWPTEGTPTQEQNTPPTATTLNSIPSALRENYRFNVYASSEKSVEEPSFEVINAIAVDPIQLALKQQHRLNVVKRALSVTDVNAPVDEDYDMELAEINVFRPVFRYRVAYSKQVKNQGQPFG